MPGGSSPFSSFHRTLTDSVGKALTYCNSGPPETFDSQEQLLVHCT